MTAFDPHISPTTYLTADIPGIGGRLKVRPEDFLVEEIPAYEPAGSGEHIYLLVQKTGLSTLHMCRMLADHFGVKRTDVGVAGLKDKHAVTTQVVSIHTPGRTPEDFPKFTHPKVEVLWADLHTNKLKRGHLKGNRFVIRVRDVSAQAVVPASRALDRLARLGAPNRIGEQRFGALRNNHLVGRALIQNDRQAVIEHVLGPSTLAPNMHADARALFVEGKFEEALRAFPPSAHTERRMLASLVKGPSAKRAVEAIERTEQSFFVTAVQSAVFNAVIDARLAAGTLGTLVEGDLAFKHDSGAVFPVTSETLADPSTAERLKRVEISPSGPMWGPEMTHASGDIGRLEAEALAATGITLEQVDTFARRNRESMLGQRRPLRIPVLFPDIEGGRDEHGDYVKLRFELPRGSFATTVMQEIMKSPNIEDDDDALESP